MAEQRASNGDRVVITGLGVVSALGCCIETFWRRLLAGQSGVRALPDAELANCRTRIGARVVDYEPSSHFSTRDLNRLSLTSQFALVAASEALHSANLEPKPREAANVGVVLGASSGGFVAVEPMMHAYFREKVVRNPLSIPVAMNNAPASNVSIRYGLRGPMMTIDAACASAAHAIGCAFTLIRAGAASIVLTGGTDSSFSPAIVHAWSSLRALSERNDMPESACRPFSHDRDGMVLGEGAGILVLESERSARERGATILAELSGYAATSDGHHLTRPAGDGISRAMRLALSHAGLSSDDIDYINAHATATPSNDSIETQAIKEVFGERARSIPIVAIKPAIGHSIAATGALELISCVLSIRNGMIPPTLNRFVPDPACDLDYVTEGARPYHGNHIMSNSFAFGGSNGVLVVSRYQN